MIFSLLLVLFIKRMVCPPSFFYIATISITIIIISTNINIFFLLSTLLSTSSLSFFGSEYSIAYSESYNPYVVGSMKIPPNVKIDNIPCATDSLHHDGNDADTVGILVIIKKIALISALTNILFLNLTRKLIFTVSHSYNVS